MYLRLLAAGALVGGLWFVVAHLGLWGLSVAQWVVVVAHFERCGGSLWVVGTQCVTGGSLWVVGTQCVTVVAHFGLWGLSVW
jgi:hypothetical protein